MTLALIAVAALLAQAPAKPAKASSSGTMKELVKSATGSAAAPAEGAAAGPDLEKLPFTPDSIKQVVVFHQGKIQSCYEEHLAVKDKAVEGQLKTTFVITGDGLVKGAKVDRKSSTLKDPKLHDCVVAVLSAMAFPKPPDAKDHPIEYPFNLKAIQ